MATINQGEHDVELSIIILSYNTATLTADCIKSIYASFKDRKTAFEVIVLDNDSQDDSVNILRQLKKEYNSLEIIESKVNLGFAKGNNKAAEKAKGEYLLFLNSETVVINHAIDDLLKYYIEHTEIHFLGPKLLNKDNSPQPSCGP